MKRLALLTMIIGLCIPAMAGAGEAKDTRFVVEESSSFYDSEYGANIIAATNNDDAAYSPNYSNNELERIMIERDNSDLPGANTALSETTMNYSSGVLGVSAPPEETVIPATRGTGGSPPPNPGDGG